MMSEDWRFCNTCGGGTIHDEHDVKHGGIPFVCRECGTETITITPTDDDDYLTISEEDDE